MSKKDLSNEALARMMAKGFEDMQTRMATAMASKDDLKNEIGDLRKDLKQDIENISLRLDNAAHKFEVKDLDRRVTVLENKRK